MIGKIVRVEEFDYFWRAKVVSVVDEQTFKVEKLDGDHSLVDINIYDIRQE